MVDWGIFAELGGLGLFPHDNLDSWWRAQMGISTIYNYAFSSAGSGISGLLGLYNQASVLSELGRYNAMVAQGQTNLGIIAAVLNKYPGFTGTVTVVENSIIIDPKKGMTTCTGPATVSAVGPKQAPYTGVTGALYSQYDQYSIPGGIPRTVAVQNGFLGLSRELLRQYGTQIYLSFSDNGAIANSGGPMEPYTISDLGDQNIQNSPTVRFDLYRWDIKDNAIRFGIQAYTGTVTFPTASGGSCPTNWSKVP
jgi:hypothetical protein